MDIVSICKNCEKSFTIGVLLLALSVPPTVCEKCEHNHQPHGNEEMPRVSFINPTVIGVVSSVVATLPPF